MRQTALTIAAVAAFTLALAPSGCAWPKIGVRVSEGGESGVAAAVVVVFEWPEPRGACRPERERP